MIREIHIRNLALIEDVTLEFQEGLSVFTGETGAGKSILIGAIGLLMGERATAESIRNGCDEAEVCGTFVISPKYASIRNFLDELHLPIDDNQIIIRRRISRSDKNKIHINQIPVPLSTLKSIGNLLLDLHGQHEHQSLLNEESHLSIIDEFPSIKKVKQEYIVAYQEYSKCKSELNEHISRAKSLREKKDFLEFQYNELHTINLKNGEEQELEEELSLLANASQRIQAAQEILAILNSEENSLIAQISTLRKKLEKLCKFDSSLNEWIQDTEKAGIVFTELDSFCNSYLNKVNRNDDPQRIDVINSRLAKIQRLKKKYGESVDQLIIRKESLKKDLESIVNSESDQTYLDKKCTQALNICFQKGKDLSQTRKEEAQSFDKMITQKMEGLGFKGGIWETEFSLQEEPGQNGIDSVRFKVRTNPGEETMPLVKVASGGEISRLMLAIKSVLSEQDTIPILIFDEVDTGVGGNVAIEIGKELYKLSRSHQVICITHLHQIASAADSHYTVFKVYDSNRTTTRAKVLTRQERVEEIARMLGGNSETTRMHAEEMLKTRFTK